jgi:hypothetical protein
LFAVKPMVMQIAVQAHSQVQIAVQPERVAFHAAGQLAMTVQVRRTVPTLLVIRHVNWYVVNQVVIAPVKGLVPSVVR